MIRTLRWAVGFGALATMVACSSAGSDATTGEGEEDLTSLTARQRVLNFQGAVYVQPDATDTQILEVAHAQTQTAFGALLNAEVAAQSRELQNIDPATFRKRPVTVVDVAGGTPSREMLEVSYKYTDNAVVPIAMSRKTALSLAVLGQGHGPKTKDVVAACTKNDREAREDADAGLLWYNFNPSKASCRKAMEQEQRQIDTDNAQLEDSRKQVPLSRAERVYLPVTMQLSRAQNATRATYPEYDRLFTGGAEPGVLTIAIVNGRLAHHRVEARKDGGYYEWMAALDVIFTEVPGFEMTKIEPAANVSAANINGRTYDNLKFTDFIQWTVYGAGWPTGLPSAGRDDIAKRIADTLDGRWVTFEKKTKVQIGDGPEKDFTIRIETLFGAEQEVEPHRRAIKRGDVVLYNGHSYIGYGPLDPENFNPSSFSNGYQILFFDSCVSYNYYEKDFFTLKEGGSKNLELITNGLEAPEWMSGEAQGAMVAKLIGGKMPSYQTLLKAGQATDSLRVVDGEIDNRFSPARTRIKLAN